MSLYGDLPAAKGSEGTMPAPPRIPFAKPTPIPMAPPSMAPSQATKRRAAVTVGNPVTGPAPAREPRSGQAVTKLAEGDEYDPAVPNEFSAILRERKQRLEAAQAALGKIQDEMMAQQGAAKQDADAPRDQANGATSMREPGRDAGTGEAGGAPDAAPTSMVKAVNKGGLTAAQKMMQKMGWKSGEGLGKNRQGMATPLVMETGEGGGHATIRLGGLHDGLVEADPTARSADPLATRVVLLQNMVGRGEVDDELEDEVADECDKYGPVVRVVIFEVADEAVPDEQSVRIFVEFRGSAAAERALRDLDGRFFAGREVSASYFDEGKYMRQEFALQS